MIDWLKASGATIAFVGGTGLHLDLDKTETRPFSDLRGLTVATTVSHKGQIEIGSFAGQPLIQVRGRLHAYETGKTSAMFPIYEALAKAGVERVIISGAVGSMTETLAPGSLAQIRDHLFFGGASPLVGIPNAFVEMGDAYVQDWASGLPQLTYAWTHGPHLETPAEIQALKALGGEVVGMSMAPEVIMARYFGMEVYGVVAAVNWAAGCGTAVSIDAMLKNAAKASQDLPRFLEPIIKQA